MTIIKFDKPLSSAKVETIAVVIDNVAGALPGFDDAPRQYTVPEGVDIVATGPLPIPDQKFRVPFARQDTGRIQLMVAEVVDGQFMLTMNFKTGGIWVVNSELLNSNLPAEVFSIEDHTFAVI